MRESRAVKEPREIVNDIHAAIAAQSPGHAALVAAFKAMPPPGTTPRILRDIEAWKRAHRAGIRQART